MTWFAVSDPADPRIAEFLGLRDRELRLQREGPGGDLAGIFIAEGDLVVERALRAGYVLRAVLVDARRREPLPALVPPSAPVYAGDEAVVRAITGFHVHRGVIASFDRRPVPTADEVLAGARSAVVLENVVNPTNLGVVVRSAAGLGVDALVLDPSCVDPLYRRAARVSMGEVYALPYARLPRFPGGLEVVRRQGFHLVALTPDLSATPLERLVLPAGARPALVLGSEGHGLPAETLDLVDDRVCIPMQRGVDSLNVGAAAAVAMWALLHGRG